MRAHDFIPGVSLGSLRTGVPTAHGSSGIQRVDSVIGHAEYKRAKKFGLAGRALDVRHAGCGCRVDAVSRSAHPDERTSRAQTTIDGTGAACVPGRRLV
ncbi:hypothetical protein RR42_s1549 [Cupriavidus basilensis]|uniref:Uncharacterized protein n=1 Tax=Cupriavidus basilensis TaxID=68895 RepID=A0A0C4YC38_9BURK|nr:hypothetical protein RR42_s1549 [Cupriavidus basilensis]